MSRKFILSVLILSVCVCFSGCYDMVDIEDIRSVAAVCVDDSSITYCIVTASADEKKYSLDIYNMPGNNLYHGIDAVSKQTGKEISLSHMEAIMFSTNCSHHIAKQNINALLGSTNSHPKAMAVFYDGDTKAFLESMNVTSDTSFSKKIKDVLENRFSGNIQCTAMDLCYALNFDGGGVSVPVIKLDDDGNVQFDGTIFANVNAVTRLDKHHSDILTVMHSRGQQVPMSIGTPVEVKSTRLKTDYNKKQNKILIEADFEYNPSYSQNTDEKLISETINNGINYILNERYNGFDMMNLQSDIKKSFATIPQWEQYIKNYGDINSAVKAIEVNIKININKKRGV